MATNKPQGKQDAKSIANDNATACPGDPIRFPSVEYIEPVYRGRAPKHRTSSPAPLVLEKFEKDFPVSHYLTRSVMRQCQIKNDQVPVTGTEKQKRRYKHVVHSTPKVLKSTTLAKTAIRDVKIKKSPKRKESQVKPKLPSSHVENETLSRTRDGISTQPARSGVSSPIKQVDSSRGMKSGFIRRVKQVATRVRQSFQTSAEKSKSVEGGQAEVQQISGVQWVELTNEFEKNEVPKEAPASTRNRHFVGTTTKNLDVSLPVTCFGRGKVNLQKVQSPAKRKNLVKRRRRILWVKKDSLPEVSTPLQPRPCRMQPEETDVTQIKAKRQITLHNPSDGDIAANSIPAQNPPKFNDHQSAHGSDVNSSNQVGSLEVKNTCNTAKQSKGEMSQNLEKKSGPSNEISRQNHVIGKKLVLPSIPIDGESSSSNAESSENQGEVSRSNGSSKNSQSTDACVSRSETCKQSNIVNPTDKQTSSSLSSTASVLINKVTPVRISVESNTAASNSKLVNEKCQPSGSALGKTVSDASRNTPGNVKETITTNEFRVALSSILLRREKILLMLRRLGVPDVFITKDKLCSSHLEAVLKEKLNKVQTVEEKKLCIQLMNHFSATRAVKQQIPSAKKPQISKESAAASLAPLNMSVENSEMSHQKESGSMVSEFSQKTASSLTTKQSHDQQAQPATFTSSMQRAPSSSLQNERITTDDTLQPVTNHHQPTVGAPPQVSENAPVLCRSEPFTSASLRVPRKPKPTPRRTLIFDAVGDFRPNCQVAPTQYRPFQPKQSESAQADSQLSYRAPVPLQRQPQVSCAVSTPVAQSVTTSVPKHCKQDPHAPTINLSVNVTGYSTKQVLSSVAVQKPLSEKYLATTVASAHNQPNSSVQPSRHSSDNATRSSSDQTLTTSVVQKPSSAVYQVSHPKKTASSSGSQSLGTTSSISSVRSSAHLQSSSASDENSRMQHSAKYSASGQCQPSLTSSEHRSVLTSLSASGGINRSQAHASNANFQMTSEAREQSSNLPVISHSISEQDTSDIHITDKHLAIPSIVKGREVARDMTDFVANIPLDAMTEIQSNAHTQNLGGLTHRKRCVDETEPEISGNTKRTRLDTNGHPMNRPHENDVTNSCYSVPLAPETNGVAFHLQPNSSVLSSTRTFEPVREERPTSKERVVLDRGGMHSEALQNLSDSSRCETCIITWKLLSMYPDRFYGTSEVAAVNILRAPIPSSGGVNVNDMDDTMLRQRLSLFLSVGRQYGWRPHLYARDLVFQMFTVGELKGRTFRTLDPRRIVAIRQCINEKFSINDFLFRVVCERFVNKAIRELFNIKLSYLMFEIEAHSVIHGIDQQVASVVAAVTSS